MKYYKSNWLNILQYNFILDFGVSFAKFLMAMVELLQTIEGI